jgi:hypothetical protein
MRRPPQGVRDAGVKLSLRNRCGRGTLGATPLTSTIDLDVVTAEGTKECAPIDREDRRAIRRIRLAVIDEQSARFATHDR